MTETLINLIQNSVINHPSSAAIKENIRGDSKIITYSQLYTRIKELGTGLIAIGVKPGTHVALIAEKNPKNIITEFAIAGCGAIIIPINPETDDRELQHILTDSNAEIVIVDTEDTMNRVNSLTSKNIIPKMGNTIRKYIILDSNYKTDTNILNIFKTPIYGWEDIVERGRKKIERGERQFDLRAAGVNPTDIQSINYTAGTTSIPKGVLLSHANIISSINALAKVLKTSPNENWSSYLPGRTIFERIIDYFSLYKGHTIVINTTYTGKGNEIDNPEPLKDEEIDFIILNSHQLTEIYKTMHKQTNFISRLVIKLNLFWYKLLHKVTGNFQYYSKGQRAIQFFTGIFLIPLYTPIKLIIQPIVSGMKKKKLSKNLKGIICAGNYLPKEPDYFLTGMGLDIIEGYGLTEASGFVSIRAMRKKSLNDMGNLLPWLKISIRDEKGHELPPGVRGIVYLKGPQIMQGYYKLPELTKQILADDGWLNTGDIGSISLNGKLAITGKEEFRIQISPNSYIEPEPIEEAITQSEYIDNAVLIDPANLGNSHKSQVLSETEEGNRSHKTNLIIIPRIGELKEIAKKLRISFSSEKELVTNRNILKILTKEVKKKIPNRETRETANQFLVVPASFRIGKELTINYTKKRNEIIKELKDK